MSKRTPFRVEGEIACLEMVKGVAIVDAEDAERLSQYWWLIAYTNAKTPYVIRGGFEADLVYLTREIMGTPPEEGLEVLHVNGDHLDYRRGNLKWVSRSTTLARRPHGWGQVGFRGVTKARGCERWVANITYQCQKRYIGSYLTPEDAAVAWDKAAKELRGDLAILNFPEEK